MPTENFLKIRANFLRKTKSYISQWYYWFLEEQRIDWPRLILPLISVCRNATHLATSGGTIHSPEFPTLLYPNNMNCVWQITTPPNTRIGLKVRSMSIQICDKIGTPEACSCDFLEIRDGKSSSDRLLATLCGNKLPGDLYSSGRHLWVRFSSDGSVADSGFVASFSSAKITEGGLKQYSGKIGSRILWSKLPFSRFILIPRQTTRSSTLFCKL